MGWNREQYRKRIRNETDSRIEDRTEDGTEDRTENRIDLYTGGSAKFDMRIIDGTEGFLL